jgi:DNA polymerase-4
VFLPSDRAAYDAASDEVMAALRSFGAPVDVLGWDEAFLGVRTADPEVLADEVRTRVRDRTSLSCAVGIGQTKLQAKTATGFAKPGGIARLTTATWLPTMGDRPVTALNGIGARTEARLAELGIRTVAQLASADHRELAEAFGPTIGPNLKLTGMGGRPAPVSGAARIAKGRSREVTYPRDLTDRADIEREVADLARELARSVVADRRRVTHVAVKVRTATFYTRTKISKLPAATADPEVVAAKALEVLDRFPLDRAVRLLGVRVVLDAA